MTPTPDSSQAGGVDALNGHMILLKVFLWRRLDARTRGNFDRRWWHWFGPGVVRRSCRGSSSRRRRRSSTGFGRRTRRGSAERRSDKRRADGAAPDQAREPSAARRARHSGKGRGLVRPGDRLDTGKVFEFAKANRAEQVIAGRLRATPIGVGSLNRVDGDHAPCSRYISSWIRLQDTRSNPDVSPLPP